MFIDRVRNGQLRIGQRDVLVIDEVGTLSTKMLLDVLQLRAKYSFSIVAVGDFLQCRSPEASAIIELLRRALGAEAIPEILTTLRQHSERERATTLLFREARAGEALDIKRDDGTARLVAGDYSEVVSAIADLWQKRRAANIHDPDYTLTVSAPTNSDARAVAAAIRHHRRAPVNLGLTRCNYLLAIKPVIPLICLSRSAIVFAFSIEQMLHTAINPVDYWGTTARC